MKLRFSIRDYEKVWIVSCGISHSETNWFIGPVLDLILFV